MAPDLRSISCPDPRRLPANAAGRSADGRDDRHRGRVARRSGRRLLEAGAGVHRPPAAARPSRTAADARVDQRGAGAGCGSRRPRGVPAAMDRPDAGRPAGPGRFHRCLCRTTARSSGTDPACASDGRTGPGCGDHLLDRGLASHRRWTRRYVARSLSERNRRSLSARRGTVESRPHGATRVRSPLLAGPSLGEHHGRTARPARAGLDRRRAGHARPRAVERFPRPRPARRRRLDRRGQPAVARWLDA